VHRAVKIKQKKNKKANHKTNELPWVIRIKIHKKQKANKNKLALRRMINKQSKTILNLNQQALVRRNARWNISLSNIKKNHEHFEIFQDRFFEIFHEIFTFYHKVTKNF